ncbi:MAG: ankyrin repeat domain-containing protein [Gemmatimonas sp.]
MILVSMQAFTRAQFRANSNAAGDLTFFRAGPMRELIEAINRNDAATVATLAPNIDVNASGMADMTPLVAALRQLRQTPDQQDVLKSLIKAGVDPNKGTEYELPLEMALQISGETGPEPVKLLLEAGANPNQKTSFGKPIYFTGSGRGASADVLTLLLDHGADLKATDPKGETALMYAATTPNWKAVLVLLERGADRKIGRSFNGSTFEQVVEEYARQQQARGPDPRWADSDAGLQEVIAYLKAH